MNINLKQPPKHRQSVAGSSVPSMPELTGGKLKKAVSAASVAAMIGFGALSTACADPAPRMRAATVELAGYEMHPREYHCLPLFRGKYTGWRCEYNSAEGTRNAIANTP